MVVAIGVWGTVHHSAVAALTALGLSAPTPTSRTWVLLRTSATPLAIESPPTPCTTIHPAVRHCHDFDLNSAPGPSTPSDLLTDADHNFLTIASTIAADDHPATGLHIDYLHGKQHHPRYSGK